MKTLANIYNIEKEEEINMSDRPFEAEINWRWLNTKNGKRWLQKLNFRIENRDDDCELHRCDDIGCPFYTECDLACGLAFKNYNGSCPCFAFKSPLDLAIILSDYYDMIKK